MRIAAAVRLDEFLCFLRGFAGEDAVDIIRLGLRFDEVHHIVHFVIAHERALQAGRLGIARLQEQQIAVFQQIFRAHLVENRAAVDAALHGERHAGRHVGLNQAGNHVHARALGGDNHVDAGGACFLRQSGNLRFH